MVSIQSILNVPLSSRSPAHLMDMIACAIRLEHATLPPYLCAMWSIQDGGHPAYNILLDIVMEEMGHMGLMCNLLTTVGGSPRLTAPGFVLSYPSPLPCDIVPRVIPPNLLEWKVGLSRLTPAGVSDIFMIIEYPENGPVATWSTQRRPFHTIGEFYDALAATLRFLVEQQQTVQITGDRQIEESITTDNAVTAINTLDDALCAIAHIKEQGEGTPHSPGAVDFDNELAHYYRFKQIQVGRMYVQQPDKTWSLEGPFLDFPAVYPMADIPPGGYTGPGLPPEIGRFNDAYRDLLAKLQAAWDVGGSTGHTLLQGAEIIMDNLGGIAQTLMTTWIDPNDHTKGTYGPTFQVS